MLEVSRGRAPFNVIYMVMQLQNILKRISDQKVVMAYCILISVPLLSNWITLMQVVKQNRIMCLFSALYIARLVYLMESVSLQTQLDFNVFVTLDLPYPLINLVIIRLAVITFI